MPIMAHINMSTSQYGTQIASQSAFTTTPVIRHMCNMFIQTDIVTTLRKQARVLPLLKKPLLETDTPNSYHPIFNFSWF